MLFWEKTGATNAPLIDKPLDQSRLPSRFAQGRDLFAEPDSEDEALGLVELEDNRNAGIRAPELNPVDHSLGGLGSLSTIKQDFSGRLHGDLPDLDLDHHLQYHTDARGDARYYTQTTLKPITGLSVLDVEDGYGKGYRNATRFINFSVGAGHAGFAIKLNSSGRVDPTMLGGGGGFVEDAFTTIDCPQGTDPVADSATDTLQFLEGSTKISVTGDSAADSVTFDVVEANIDHGSIAGLADDDHTQYLLESGARNVTGDLQFTGLTKLQFRDSTITINSPSANNMVIESLGFVAITRNGKIRLLSLSDGIQIGSGVLDPGIDLKILFNGESNIGIITWMEDEARFDFDSRVKTDVNFESAVATGTSPLIVASTTVCTNLNADLLDGSHASAFAGSSHTHLEADITDLTHTDATAVHDNVSGEIAAITEKASPVDADLILIEDSADSNNKKRVQVGSLPGGGGGGDVTGPASSLDNELVVFDGTSGKIVQSNSGILTDNSGNLTLPDLGKLVINAAGITTGVFSAQVQAAADAIMLASTWRGGRSAGNGAAGLGIRHLVQLENSVGMVLDATKIEHVWNDATTGTEDSRISFHIMLNGSFANQMTVDENGVTLVTPTIVNFSNSPHTHLSEVSGGTLDASAIASGLLSLSRGGCRADLSSTGGTSQVLKQVSSGADITVGTIAAADLSDGSALLKNIVEDTTPQLGGELDAGAHTIGFTLQTATGDGTTTIDWRLGNKFSLLFGAQDDTFTFTAPTKPCSLILKLIQDGTGGRTATWPATVKWAGGTSPTLTIAGGAVDIIAFYFDGTNYHGTASLDSK